MERGKSRRVGATLDPRRVSTRQAGEYGDAGGTHPYRTWSGRGVFHPRPTSDPLRAGISRDGTWEVPACWGYPRFPSCIHTPGGGIWGRGWNASLPGGAGAPDLLDADVAVIDPGVESRCQDPDEALRIRESRRAPDQWPPPPGRDPQFPAADETAGAARRSRNSRSS